MSSERDEAIVDEYMRRAGNSDGGRYMLATDELAWMLGHCTRMATLRLQLLRAVQAALNQEGGGASDLKELLTNLIIMQSRMAEREEHLDESLRRVLREAGSEHVMVDEAGLRGGIQASVDAWGHLRAVTGANG